MKFSQSCVQNHSLGSLWVVSLPIFLALSDWLSLLQLHLLPPLSCFCLFVFICLFFFGFRSGNTKLLMGSRTHQNASHLCLCSLSCHAGNTSPSIVLFANSDAFSKILLFRYLLLIFIHAQSTSGSPMLFSPGITLYCNLFVYAARP